MIKLLGGNKYTTVDTKENRVSAERHTTRRVSHSGCLR